METFTEVPQPILYTDTPGSALARASCLLGRRRAEQIEERAGFLGAFLKRKTQAEIDEMQAGARDPFRHQEMTGSPLQEGPARRWMERNLEAAARLLALEREQDRRVMDGMEALLAEV